MLNVSAGFHGAVDAPSRNVKGAVVVTFDETISLDEATATATTYASEATPPSKVCTGRFREADYALTGMMPTRLQGPHYGWQSARNIAPDGSILPIEGSKLVTLDYTDFQRGKLTDLEVVEGALQLKSVGSSIAEKGYCVLEVDTVTVPGELKQVRLNWEDTENASYLVGASVSFDDGANWISVFKGGVIPFDYSQPLPPTFKLKITLRNGNYLPSLTWIPLQPGLILPIALDYKESTKLLSVSLQYDYTIGSAEELIVDYGRTIRTRNLLLTTSFTSIISDFKIEAYDPNTGAWTLVEDVVGNNSYEWARYYPNALRLQKLKLTVKRMKSPSSRIVVLYFGAVAQLIFEGDDVVDFSILEEMRAEGSAPLGSVTANECSVTFKNDYRWFTPQNKQSPLHGLLKPKTLFEPYLGVEVSPNTFEMVPMGKFRSTDWNAPSTSVDASITGYDRLYEIGDLEVPLLPVLRNVKIKDLFEILFQAIGLQPDEYDIDPTLVQSVQIGWIPEGKVFDALRVMTEAGNCSVTTDRLSRILVRNNFQYIGQPVARFTDDDHIFEIDNPQRILDTYTHVKVDYKLPSLKPVQEILVVDDLEIQPGSTTLRNLKFREAPVALVTTVQLLNNTSCKITHFEYGAWGMNITINNTSSDTEIVKMIVYGRPIELASSAQTAVNYEILASGVKERIYSIDNPLIQNPNVAKIYSAAILDYLSDPLANFSMQTRGNPALELRDIIEVESITDKIPLSRVSIMRSSVRFDGGLSIDIDAKKPIVPSYWIFLAPGHMVKAYQKLENIYE